MRVYSKSQPDHGLFVTPANDERGRLLDGASQWKTPDGAPIQYHVRFVAGVAEVPAELGQWLIKHGYANRTRLFMPAPKRLVA